MIVEKCKINNDNAIIYNTHFIFHSALQFLICTNFKNISMKITVSCQLVLNVQYNNSPLFIDLYCIIYLYIWVAMDEFNSLLTLQNVYLTGVFTFI